MRVFVVASLLLLALPQRAHAWADATVRSASARVTVDENAHAHVAIDATLRIEGGWLEALELDGLDEGLVLDPLDPVTMTTAPTPEQLAGGQVAEPLAPAVTLRSDGVLVLSFTRRHAPRRGDYLVHFAYDASLAAHVRTAPEGPHVDWTFPAWRHGLDSVRVELTVPHGAAPVLGSDDEITSEQHDEGAVTVFTLTRAHLARTREWPIDLAFPDDVLAPGLVAPPEVVVHDRERAPEHAARPPWQGGVALALASVLVAVRILRRRARDREASTLTRPRVPLPDPARALVVLGLGAAGMGVLLVGSDVRWAMAIALATIVLGAHHASQASAPRLGSFRHATPSIRAASRRARWRRALGVDAWLDASAPAGLVLLLALGTLAAQAPVAALGAVALAGAVVLASMLDGVRASRPLPPLVALADLLSLARRVRVPLDVAEGDGLALMPVVHLDVRGVAQEARLRVMTSLPEGTLRADVVVASSGPLGTRHALLVVAAKGSAIDRALASDPDLTLVAVGQERVARAIPVHARSLGAAIERLRSAVRAAPATSNDAPDVRAAS